MAVRNNKLVEVATLNLDGYTMKEAVKYLQALMAVHGEDVRISEESRQYEEGKYLALLKSVPETDAEMEVRIAQEAEWQAKRDAHERREFERLQAKFAASNVGSGS